MPSDQAFAVDLPAPLAVVFVASALLSTSTQTRLHSSRLRTARALTVSPSMLCGRGGVPGPGGVPGGCAPGPGGVYLVRYSPCGQTHAW